MPIIVQNDAGTVPEANAYITVAWFRDYHSARGVDNSALTDPEVAQAIIRSTDYLDTRFRFVGVRLIGREQTTAWPRANARDVDCNEVVGIPLEVKKACAEYALRATDRDLNPDPAVADNGAVIASESSGVGPLRESYSYFTGAGFPIRRYPAADNLLIRTGLVISGATVRIWG